MVLVAVLAPIQVEKMFKHGGHGSEKYEKLGAMTSHKILARGKHINAFTKVGEIGLPKTCWRPNPVSHRSILSLGSGKLGCCLLSSPQKTTDDIGGCTASVGTQDLDSDEICTLGDTVLARADCISAVGPIAVSELVGIVLRNGLAPGCAILELDMVNVNVGVDNVHVNALAVFRFVLVE